ncbi:ABC transporter permease [Phreatobacter sp. AB_2022a]|uniref:ABC transporter permease n=1 Tax=Phreatobacter sp. AB_2022a TaxID=3003134 RepID=UPI002286D279|nr:ABC transporter permease [Phreatobacter sp. AB_2022a]MCZ0738037.1 ABC transporter permease [Phreatobacter sp. AB_2022a]
MTAADRPRPGRPVILALGWLGLIFLLAPLAVVFPVSLTPERYLSMPSGGVSFQHYAKLVTDLRWSSSILTSLAIAALTTVFATALGTLCAIGLWRLGGTWTRYLRIMILAPLIVPPIVHALAFYRTWIDLNWLDTLMGVVVAHTIICIPLVLITVSTSLSGFDRRLEQAARSLGAPPATVLRRIVLPNIAPGILSGAAFSFVTSWDEVVAVLFLTSRKVVTLPIVIWNSLTERVDPAVAAVSAVMILATLAAVVARLVAGKA